MPTAPDGDSKRPEETSTSVYAGLANNASSNLCFLNSVIQALASTSDLEDYLQQLRATAEHAAGEPAGIVDGLLEIIAELNTPRDRRTVLRPTKFIECLRANNASSARLFNSNQQDAHELLVMILEAVEDEVSRSARHRSSSSSIGLAGLLDTHPSPPSPPKPDRKILRNPFRGLMANRIACAACGFSAGIRHSPTDHLSITLPVCATCTLEDCLKEYTVLELLDDYMCRKCTLLNREREMKTELEACRSKRKRAELKNDLQSLSEAIKVHPEQELHPLLEHSLSPIWSPMSTKQTMFARPPRVLTVHVSRSTVMGEGHLTKNYCRLVFPELLILDRFTTTERLSARAEAPISRPPGAPSDRTPAVSYPYRLLALIVHQGTHLSGHYLTFRRSPQGSWWRLSDQDVDRCPVREALDSNPTLLIYQRLGDEDQPQL
ncbi:hypothetical protein PTTG_25179 [Puccinia triticina 1-1 BBBD Race 1]|uniref:ubiquitinyl hydrolase 1 n=1 Tax=Puccinia triticina (isolate 1-1 / race 1 (BBBD)) TaxID=630390 RepID=A0A180H572_PUCT1|nr:hypothetical protein PTTG_25179 [Puccinia triticina 1-1 BBBD Race 1]